MGAQLFAGIAVSDLTTSVEWYRRLLGRDASFRPDDTEAVWQLDDGVFVYVKAGRSVVGGALTAVTTDDLDAFLADASGRGISAADIETYEEGARKAVFFDPDGNEFGVISIPSAAE